MKLIATLCKQHGIALNASDFKINTRRENVVQQLRKLKIWQYRQQRGALPAKRRIEFDKFFGLVAV